MPMPMPMPMPMSAQAAAHAGNVMPFRPTPVPPPDGRPPDLSQLPPVIAESLAKLAAGRGARTATPHPEPIAPQPPGPGSKTS
jgi:hypothetical protein